MEPEGIDIQLVLSEYLRNIARPVILLDDRLDHTCGRFLTEDV